MSMAVREEKEQARHDERMAAAKRDTDIRERELEFSISRDKREWWLFWVAIVSLGVSIASLLVASLALYCSLCSK